MFSTFGLVVFSFFSMLIINENVVQSMDVYRVDCSTLRMGQYLCPDPDHLDFIDPATQQPKGCTKENKAKGYFFTYFFYHSKSKF